MSCYPKPDSYGRNKIKVGLDLCNYAKRNRIPSDFAKMVDLASLKSDVDELDID